MVENTESPSEATQQRRETMQLSGSSGQSDRDGDLHPALDQLDPGKPLLLNDGFFLTDGGHLIWSQYVDIGLTKLEQRPRVIVKAIEARYGLEHASTIRLSAPHRFREYGETFIQDDQEGKALRERRTEGVAQRYGEKNREQEHALEILGIPGMSIDRSGKADSHTDSESLTFGRSSWMYCTSILPASDKREVWRKHLPKKYDHESVIRQPAKFAQALGLMFADQVGAEKKGGHFSHAGSIRSSHESQPVFHGPVWYTDDVHGFLKEFTSDPLYLLYPLFVKDSQYRAQREYRFVLHRETPVQEEWLDLSICGMMRDALAPPQSSSPVGFEAADGESGSQHSQTVTSPGKQATTRTRRNWSSEKLTFKVDGVVAQEQTIAREEVLELTIEAPADDAPESTDAVRPATPAVAQVEVRESRESEFEGAQIESAKMVRRRIYYIKDAEEADELFAFEDRDRVEDILEAVRRPFTDFARLPPEISAALMKLAEQVLAVVPDKEVEAMSACWNSLWAICNLYACFGDIVESVGIEQDEFVAIVLKSPADGHAEGKLLVGPRGTYAFVLVRGDERSPGYGGEETRVLVFPDEKTRETFEEFGWSPVVDGVRETPAD